MKKTKWISSVLLFLAVFMIALVGCEQPGTEQPGAGSTQGAETTQLVIKNQSFTDLEEVIWNGIVFSTNELEKIMKVGTSVSKSASEGSSYIFFKRKSSPIFARTQAIVFVETGKTTEFTFTNNIIILEQHNDTNSGTLQDLQSTVVFFDDAEGETQQYHQKRSFVGYYSAGADLPSSSSGMNVNSPKKGKSIAIGYTETSALHLKVNLERKAKLSFWVSNSWVVSSDDNAYLTVNGVEKNSFPKMEWSFQEVMLEPGETDLIWANPSGLYSTYSYAYGQYLSLDDILIIYTEEAIKQGQLVIKNQSFSDLEEVRWGGTVFSNNESAEIIAKGTEVTSAVNVGESYIYFKRTSSPVFARTESVVSVADGETKEFTLANTTPVIEQHNTANTGTLQDLQRTVQLVIKNQSFSDLEEIRWNGIVFSNTESTDIIRIGTSVSKAVNVGSDYIYFKRTSSPVFARTQAIVSVEEEGKTIEEFILTDTTPVLEPHNTANTGTLQDLQRTVQFVIKNQSFTDLEKVRWNDTVIFSNNEFEEIMRTGTEVSKLVPVGEGFIYFKRKSSPVFARTQAVILGNDSETTKEFIFADTIPILERHNLANTGTLQDLQLSVVFFDDAEGQIKTEYFNREYFANYYATRDALPSSSRTYAYSPKEGKSIAIGYYNDSALHLKVTLTKQAKLSFWVANSWYPSSDTNAYLTVNGTQTLSFSEMPWVRREVMLEAGDTDLIWANPSGLYSSYSQYLSLDNILIVYTE